MKPFEIALFKHFIEGKGMVTVYVNMYLKNHLKTNPVSIEEFLAKVDVTEVCTKAFNFYINSDYGYDYWNKMELMWMEFLATNENNYTADEWYKLQGMSKILRTNWDAAKHWRQESRLTTAIRMGIDPKLIGAEDCTPTAPPTKLSEEYLRETTRKEVLDFNPSQDAAEKPAKLSKNDVDIFGEFEMIDLRPKSHDARRLADDEISVNTRNNKGRITFNQHLSKEIKARGGYEYASLMRNKKGEVSLVLNDIKGVPVADGAKTRTNANVTIGSTVLVDKLITFLNIKHDYEIVRVTEIAKTDDYVAYLVTTI